MNEKLKKFLTEERLVSKDKRDLLKIIDKSIKGKTSGKDEIIIKSFSKDYDEDERTIEVIYKKGSVVFTYNADHFELTNTLIDICDDMGFKFKTDTERNINTITFEVIK